ncbi:MAG TPA: NAD-dependent malic enzyme [Gammaproteobacteria bacterium]|nr:NAD-dependent malic enzyme [Gammaproteobacteria bacterium]
MNDRSPRGFDVLHNPKLNKGTAFTEQERDSLGLRGLLPDSVTTQQIQIRRILDNLERKPSDIERYIFLSSLQKRNERLFYRLLIDHIETLMPLIYTPTVGEACQKFAHIFREPRGFYITPKDRGQIKNILNNWPEKDIRIIVITDGQRILGLGDLGANGMGIPIGKLSLYTAGAGIAPEHCLPVMFDVGSNNPELINDPLYLGVKQPRIGKKEYLELMDEFVCTVQDVFPQAVIQFEDFLTPNAYLLLNTWRNKVCCFNDDIQGTAAVVLSGIYSAMKLSEQSFKDCRILFLGAGSAATGMADLLVPALCAAGLTRDEALKHLWFIDRHGLVVKDRDHLDPHNLAYAHEHPHMDFLQAIEAIKPHILIGATGVAGTFTEQAVRSMAAINPRPILFALSNPTSHAECTAEQAYQWTEGRGIFASGSPSRSVNYKDQVFKPGQGNNAYIFPGLGLGVSACNATSISDEMFMAAASTLSEQLSKTQLEQGSIYPPLSQLRDVSLKIAIAVAEIGWEQKLAQKPRPASIADAISELIYDPTY